MALIIIIIQDFVHFASLYIYFRLVAIMGDSYVDIVVLGNEIEAVKSGLTVFITIDKTVCFRPIAIQVIVEFAIVDGNYYKH